MGCAMSACLWMEGWTDGGRGRAGADYYCETRTDMKSLSEHMSASGRVNHSFCKGTGSFKRGNGAGEDGIGEQHHLSLLYCLHVNTPWSRFQQYSASKFNLHRHAEEFKQARTKKRKSTSFKSKKHLIRIPPLTNFVSHRHLCKSKVAIYKTEA